MAIKHNTYFDGNVQSLGFVEGETTKITAGLMEVGEYDFGIAGPKETLVITSGKININGVDYVPGGDVCIVEPGEPIKMVVTEQSTYTCTYG